MAGDELRDHLKFERSPRANARRKRTPPRRTPPADPGAPGRRIRQELEAVEQTGEPDEPGSDPRLLLKIEVENPNADLFAAIPGLTLVAQKSRTLLILFSTEEGSDEFWQRLQQLEACEKPVRKASSALMNHQSPRSPWPTRNAGSSTCQLRHCKLVATWLS